MSATHKRKNPTMAKIQLNTKIKDLDGKPFKHLDINTAIARVLTSGNTPSQKADRLVKIIEDDADAEETTLRDVAIRSLLTGEENLPGPDKLQRTILAMSIKGAKATIDLKDDDRILIKKLIGTHEHNVLIAGRCLQLLEA